MSSRVQHGSRAARHVGAGVLCLAALLASPVLGAQGAAAGTSGADGPIDGGGFACVGAPVVRATVAGCNARMCRERGFDASIAAVADMRLGVVHDAASLDAARDRLMRLDLFRAVSFSCRSVPGGIDARIDVEPAIRIRKIRITGNRHFYDSQVLERLSVFPGDRLDPGDKVAEDALDQARETIRRAYQEDGFTGTEVATEVEDAGAAEVDVRFRVREGTRMRVERLSLGLRPVRPAGDTPPGVEGCPRVSERDLKRWSGLSLGAPMTEATGRDVERALTRALRAVGFAGVRVGVTFDQEVNRLSVDATYESCYLIRFFARDRPRPGRLGFAPVVDDSLLASLPFADSGVFDPVEAAMGREEVRTWFENRGHLMADVELEYRARRSGGRRRLGEAGEAPRAPDVDLGPNVAGQIVYLVTRNARSEIRAIRISGNRAVPTDRILAVMATRPYDFFGDTGAVLPDQVFFDIERIEQLYREEGFFSVSFAGGEADPAARIRRTERIGEASVRTYISGHRAFRVVQPPGTSGVSLEIALDEGPRSVLGSVTVDGGQVLDARVQLDTLSLHPGDPFSGPRAAAARDRLLRQYRGIGRIHAAIELRCTGHDPDVPPDQCDLQTVASRRVDLAFTVREGGPTRLGPVLVHGIRRTRSDVVKKEFPRPGGPYDAGRVAKAVRSLNDLGVFDSVGVTTVGPDETPPREEAVLVVECRENKSRFLDFVAGFEKLDDTRASDLPGYVTSALSHAVGITDLGSSGYGKAVGLRLPDILLTVETRYTDLNFLGRAKRLYLPLKYGLSTTAWDRYASFTPTYVDPRFFARGLAFRVTPFAVYDRATTRLDKVQFGAEFALSKELFPRLFGALSFETGVVNTRDPVASADYTGWRFENKVVPTLTYDRLDHPINPRNGGFLQGSLAYINSLEEGNFVKYEITGKGFVTVRNLVTFGVTARFGGSRSFGTSRSLPQDERFSLGGNRGVRGFTTDGIAQYRSDGSLRLAARVVPAEDGTDGTQVEYIKPYGGDSMFAGSVEARFPILRSLGLYGSVFYDFGALAEGVSDFNTASVRQSAGLGLRYLLAGVVPIRLDYGFILDRRCRDVDRRTGACLRKEEVGNVHFGLLYTF